MKEFLIDNLNFVLSFTLFVISFVFNIVSYIRGRIKAKTQKELEAIEIKAKDDLKQTINQLMIDAEKFPKYSGEERKQYVITRALQTANKAMNIDEIDAYIEEQINVTEHVNKHN